jgi:uncharacterized protein YbcI
VEAAHFAAPADPGDEWLRGESRAALSRAIVSVYRRYSGRGPTKVKIQLTGHGLLVVIEDFLTPMERALVACGRDDLVLGLRDSLRAQLSPSLRDVTESVVGRKVATDLSAVQVRPEMALELFVFEP